MTYWVSKVKGPAFSLAAFGSIARRVNYTGREGAAVARAHPRASRSSSAAQLARRALYAAGCAGWRALAPDEQLAQTAAARPLALTGFNLYMRTYLSVPPAPLGTQWDAGQTTWDSGDTTWDV